MATSYTPRQGLSKPAIDDPSWGGPILSAIDSIDGVESVGAFAVRPFEIPSTSLNVKVAAGTFISSTNTYVTFAGSVSFAVDADATNYLWLTNSGVLTKGSAWPGAGTKVVRLAIVVAGSSAIESITDARVAYHSAG